MSTVMILRFLQQWHDTSEGYTIVYKVQSCHISNNTTTPLTLYDEARFQDLSPFPFLYLLYLMLNDRSHTHRS